MCFIERLTNSQKQSLILGSWVVVEVSYLCIPSQRELVMGEKCLCICLCLIIGFGIKIENLLGFIGFRLGLIQTNSIYN